MKKELRVGFLCDPLDHFNPDAETTLFLMREAQRRGGRIYAFEPRDLLLKQGRLWAQATEIAIEALPAPVTDYPRRFYHVLEKKIFPLERVGLLFLRKDPPFDLEYLHHLYLLSFLEKEIPMINSPSAILQANEKLLPLGIQKTPKTLIASDRHAILDFIGKFGQGCILKPLHKGGGEDVYWVKRKERRTEKFLRSMTENFTRPIVIQEYLPAAKKGDKRVLLWQAKILGAFNRLPKRGEFRANLHQGGRFVKTKLSGRDKSVIRSIIPLLQARQLYFVGLDIIGGYLTEVNVTSPMGIREVNQLYGKAIERDIIDYALNLNISRLRSGHD